MDSWRRSRNDAIQLLPNRKWRPKYETTSYGTSPKNHSFSNDNSSNNNTSEISQSSRFTMEQLDGSSYHLQQMNLTVNVYNNQSYIGLIALSIAALIVSPFGLCALILALLAQRKSSTDTATSLKLSRASLAISIVSIVISIFVTAGVMIHYLSPCQSGYTMNGYCYYYRLQSNWSSCGHGNFTSGYCYYNGRHLINKDDEGYCDKREDGFCYYCWKGACRFASNYVNNVCYPYVFPKDSRCNHGVGVNGSNFCYYNNRCYPKFNVDKCEEDSEECDRRGTFCFL